MLDVVFFEAHPYRFLPLSSRRTLLRRTARGGCGVTAAAGAIFQGPALYEAMANIVHELREG